MAQCAEGQAPFSAIPASDPTTRFDADSWHGACEAFTVGYGYSLWNADQATNVCDGQDGSGTIHTATVETCEAALPPAAATCTASAPCVMHLTQQQTDQFESWMFVFVVVALVFAAMHGYSQGQKR